MVDEEVLAIRRIMDICYTILVSRDIYYGAHAVYNFVLAVTIFRP